MPPLRPETPMLHPRETAPHIPGEVGIWVLVIGDLFVFALLFGTVAYYRLLGPDVFHLSQATLNQTLGLTNTLALLTSSLFVVLGVDAARAGGATAKRWMTGAMLLGLLFVAFKLLEYWQKGSEGLLPDTNMFFMLYFVLTGMHLVHVLVGLIALFFVRKSLGQSLTTEQFRLVECGAIFWHMVDILWVILFAIFYLHR